MKRLRKVLWYSFLAFSAVVVLAISIPVFYLHYLPFAGKTFNKADWDVALKCSNSMDCLEMDIACRRGPMYSDLKRSHLPTGTSKQSVLELLGAAHPDFGNQTCIVYELGMCSGFKIDYDWLRICFDAQDKIESLSRYQG